MSKEKHIAFILANYNGGGAERVMITMANELSQKGWRVDLIVGNTEGHLKDLVLQSVQVHDLGFQSVSRGFIKVIRYLRSHRPHILFSTLNHVNILATISARLSMTGVKVVLREANTVSKVYQNMGKATQRDVKLSKWVYPFAHRFVAVSEGVKKDMVDFFNLKEHRIEKIYNPVVASSMVQMADAPTEHEWLDTADKPYKVILGVGRFTIPKNFVTLVRALAHIREEMDVRLIIIGEQKLDKEEYQRVHSEVEKLGLQDVVSFPGFQSNPFAYFAKADVYVLSSIHEGLPGTLIQALAIGTSVVSTDCVVGVREILGNEEYGRIVPMKDPKKMAKAIVQQLEQPTPTKAKRQARGMDFHVDQAIEKIDTFLTSLL
ncbi:MAG: glycosyltransferase [Bacteroidota bacterium]